MQQSGQSTVPSVPAQQSPFGSVNSPHNPDRAVQPSFEFIAGAPGLPARRARAHIRRRRVPKRHSAYTITHHVRANWNNQAAIPLPAALPNSAQTVPVASQSNNMIGAHTTTADVHCSAHTLQTHLQNGQQSTNTQFSSQTAPVSLQAASAAMDHSQHLASAFANMSTNADNRTTKYVSLGDPEAACFRHPDLQVAGQSCLAHVQNVYDVSGFVTTQGPAGKRPCFVNNVEIQVCQEELTSQDVSVIVNPTNPWLNADSGVSKAIASAGGAAFRDSCREILAARSGQMSRGETAMTLLPAGTSQQLKCQCVVHAALPHRSGDAAKDSASLGSLMQSVLCAAASINAKALALPLLGGGVAGWSTSLAAQALVAQVIHAANHCSLGDELRLVRFADLSSKTVAALRTELASQAPQCVLTLVGTPYGCTQAEKYIKDHMQAQMDYVQVTGFEQLSSHQRNQLLQLPVMAHLHRRVWSEGCMMVGGAKTLISQVEGHVQKLLAAPANPPFKWDSPANGFPSHWAPQQSNTELFEVDLGSAEIASLVAALNHLGHVTVLKVHRIQNKLLWEAFAENHARMRRRWKGEPGLQVRNGGAHTLWHGTNATEPNRIYATEHGFTQHFARQGLWGLGNYYSCQPALALKYAHKVRPHDATLSSHLASVRGIAGLHQVLAVDVLTGKAKHMADDRTLRLPPELEDKSIGRALGLPHLRYDSVKGVHPDGNTPIYVTYHEARGYPKYLVTYSSATQ